ncbi:MAG: CBS domain-containing protein [Acetobacteraceae bacterium]|nr:CBS domain-containing protein [Nevskiaceae bacterium]MBV9248599.1 CBS domain-containing protein [Acetobacteraceae bacterium]
MLISHVLDKKGRRVATVLPTDTVADAVRRLAEWNIGAVVVQDRWQKLVGVFSERDLVNHLAKDSVQVVGRPVEALMSHNVITCRPDDNIDAVLQVMTVNKIRHLPVLEGTRLVGIVSIGDLVKHRLDEKLQEAQVLLDISRMHA